MNDKDRAALILTCIQKILRYCRGKEYDTFAADSMLVEACVFNLSQIGELCHAMREAFVEAHPEIPWNETYGLRNRIVHNYEGVNLRLVWEIISDDLPELLTLMSDACDTGGEILSAEKE